jgi:membrane-associated phospholipid phosphatase
VDAPLPQSQGATAAQVVGDAGSYGLRFLRKHAWQIALWFFCLLLPLWAFAALVGEVHEKQQFRFDAPLLNWLHALATPALNHLFVMTSRVGYLWGVVPLDALILVLLIVLRRFRDGLFFGIAVTGSAALNLVAKNHFARVRPDLWLSIAPETTYSFPSGHAMGSMTLAMAAIILCWPTVMRWPVLIVGVSFVLLVGISRVYLGVHFPSDILAGWTAAMTWTFLMYTLVDRKAPPPPSSAAPSKDTVGQA